MQRRAAERITECRDQRICYLNLETWYVTVACLVQRRVAERIIEAWEQRMPRLEPLCRMLLVAERYGVTLLRDHCLHCLAARFEALVEERAPQREREIFEAFVAAVAPQVPCQKTLCF